MKDTLLGRPELDLVDLIKKERTLEYSQVSTLTLTGSMPTHIDLASLLA